VHPWDRLS